MDTNQVSVGTSVELETLLWPLVAKMALEELLIRRFSIVPEVDNPWEDYCGSRPFLSGRKSLCCGREFESHKQLVRRSLI